jgi:hypothetical protein
MSANLHEMHALLHQLQDLHDSHDLDHCGVSAYQRFKDAGKSVMHAATAAKKAAKESHNEIQATHKTDEEAQTKWKGLHDDTKKEILKKVVDHVATTTVSTLFLSNADTKAKWKTIVEQYNPITA